jgi:prolyl-tRNA synthetase
MQLEFRAVQADTGNIGGDNSHEFHVLAQSGEDTIAYSDTGTYAANLEKAAAQPPGKATEPSEDMGRVDTPYAKTIEAVAKQLGLPPEQNLKTLIVEGDDASESSLYAIILRGDHELNEIKAGKLPGVKSPLAFASEEAITKAMGASVGSLGPVNCNLPMFVDASAAAVADFICGANEDGVHFRGVNWHRDVELTDEQIVDARNVVEGDTAPDGNGQIKFLRGIEVGHIFQLDRSYSEPMQATVLDQDGNNIVPTMGCYGMGVTRLVAAVIEQNHDDNGITWPLPLAPFQLHIIALNAQKSEAVKEASELLYTQACEAGIDVLLDDRAERPGVKFAEADLIGIPHRVVIGDRGLKNGAVEYRQRTEASAQDVPLDNVLSKIT